MITRPLPARAENSVPLSPYQFNQWDTWTSYQEAVAATRHGVGGRRSLFDLHRPTIVLTKLIAILVQLRRFNWNEVLLALALDRDQCPVVCQWLGCSTPFDAFQTQPTS